MKKVISLLALAICLIISVNARAQFLQDSNNRPLVEKKYMDITGSPYFNDTFLKGTVRLADGKHYENVYLQYDEVQDQVLFKNNIKDEIPSVFEVPVSAFSMDLADGTTASFQSLTGDNLKPGFYQVLQTGTTSLFKRMKKNIVENASYNTANKEKRITSSTSYLIKKADGKYISLKGDKKAFLSALSGRSKEIEAFISSEKIDFKNDEDLRRLIAYYNGLS